MSPQLEHDYINGDGVSSGLNLKETELRLGLPGSDSPGRKAAGLTLELLLPAKPGAKRGFSDAIDGKWGFSGGGSEVELGKGGALFSRRGAKDSAAAAAAAAAAAGGGQMAKASASASAAAAAAEKGEDKQAPAAKAQVVGWPPIRSYRKNTMATNPVKSKEDAEAKQGCCLYVKVSMDGAPYLRKVDLKTYCNYKELSFALEKMFSGFTIGQCGGRGIPGQSEIRLVDVISGSEHVLTYEDKDGDWMLVGDVPWQMFTDSCRRLRIMKGSDAIGLAPRALEKCKNQN